MKLSWAESISHYPQSQNILNHRVKADAGRHNITDYQPLAIYSMFLADHATWYSVHYYSETFSSQEPKYLFVHQKDKLWNRTNFPRDRTHAYLPNYIRNTTSGTRPDPRFKYLRPTTTYY